jgi:hypothetical protein
MKRRAGGVRGGGDRKGGAPIEHAHARQDDHIATMGGIQPRRQRSAGPERANPAEQVGAARQRTDQRRRPPQSGRWWRCGGLGRRSRRPRRPPGWRRGRSRRWRAPAPARDDWRSPPAGRPRPSGPGRGAGDVASSGRGFGSAAAATVPWACRPYHPPCTSALS